MKTGSIYALPVFNGEATSSVNHSPASGWQANVFFNPVSPGNVPQPGFAPRGLMGSKLGTVSSMIGVGCDTCRTQGVGDSVDLGQLALGTALYDAAGFLKQYGTGDSSDTDPSDILGNVLSTALQQGVAVATNVLTSQNVGNVVMLPNGQKGVVQRKADGSFVIVLPNGTQVPYTPGTPVTTVDIQKANSNAMLIPIALGAAALLVLILVLKK